MDQIETLPEGRSRGAASAVVRATGLAAPTYPYDIKDLNREKQVGEVRIGGDNERGLDSGKFIDHLDACLHLLGIPASTYG